MEIQSCVPRTNPVWASDMVPPVGCAGGKRAEAELRRNEAFLSEGQYLARMGNFSWNLAMGDIVRSEPLYRIFAFELDKPVALDLIASRFHPMTLS
ncbi:hypothetical protein PQR70_38870 [Paraburkholderia madseniana]|uniref:Uncharacterized protein n=1 Tax=Paraburkholderia madseniana TaxID=2599607 RepID=A0AAP5BJD8_9BURK|nr:MULTISPECIES: hypothetical protein [Paraburkholderia]MCX4149647.1 hypothetical protein [Paraburkholderia madseniana]MDN7152583.1 hypothetical protein [Paraburkholderia sp. WS6]MDQ6411465.1 hypothetical protein [Paraburkholderia madseniana]